MNQRSASGKGLTAREATAHCCSAWRWPAWRSTAAQSIQRRRFHAMPPAWSPTGQVRRVALYFLIAGVLVAVIAFNSRRGAISHPYVRASA